MNRESLLATTLVELADKLSEDVDPLDLLEHLTQRSVDLVGCDAAGLLLTDQRGDLQLVVSTTYAAESVEIFALASREGPCFEAYRTGRPVVNVAASDAQQRWPRFEAFARAAGVAAVHAVPLPTRTRVIGVLSLYWTDPYEMAEADLLLAQAVAGVATIGMLHERTARQREVLAEQLQRALNARVTVEQAKGVVAEALGSDVENAFDLISAYARGHRQAVGQVAQQLVRRDLDPRLLLSRVEPF